MLTISYWGYIRVLTFYPLPHLQTLNCGCTCNRKLLGEPFSFQSLRRRTLSRTQIAVYFFPRWLLRVGVIRQKYYYQTINHDCEFLIAFIVGWFIRGILLRINFRSCSAVFRMPIYFFDVLFWGLVAEMTFVLNLRWKEIDLAANFVGCFTTTSLSPLPLQCGTTLSDELKFGLTLLGP